MGNAPQFRRVDKMDLTEYVAVRVQITVKRISPAFISWLVNLHHF